MKKLKRYCFLLLILLATPYCGRGGTEVAFVDAADAGGVEIVATSEVRKDSIRIATRITNTLDTPADLILHGACPVTLIAYDGDRLLWDEREGLTCEQSELPVPLAPGEYEMLSHSVSESELRPLGDANGYQLGIRVALARGREYMVAAPARK